MSPPFYLETIFFNATDKDGSEEAGLARQMSLAKESDVSNSKNKSNYIKLFGGFKVYDRNGNDVSSEIPSKVKQLLLLIIVYTQQDRGGVSNEDLVETLWGKSRLKDVQNNKRVTMSKLRLVLSKLDNADVVYKSRKWSIVFSEHASCDYLDFLKLAKPSSQLNSEYFDKLLKIILQGELFKEEAYEWVLPFKDFASNSIVDISHNYISSLSIKDDSDQILKLSDVILTYDSMNEKALLYKLKILISQNNYKMAGFSFEQFCLKYKEQHGVEYPVGFQQFVL